MEAWRSRCEGIGGWEPRGAWPLWGPGGAAEGAAAGEQEKKTEPQGEQQTELTAE